MMALGQVQLRYRLTRLSITATCSRAFRRTVPGYDIPFATIATGGAAQAMPTNGHVGARPDLVRSDHNGLFASGTLGRYSKVLNSVVESRLSR